jgi:hypothetical protein
MQDTNRHHVHARSARARVGVLGVVVAILVGILGSASINAAASPQSGAAVRLKVMEFNIEDGGVIVGFHSIVEAVRRADPDVVGIEEAQANIPRLARAAGFPYYSVRLQILSRFPLIDPPGSKGLYTFVQLRPGKVVAMGNVHLPSNPYSPNVIKRGGSAAKAIRLERRDRLPFVEPTVKALSRLVAEGIPAYLTGDFNAPSFRDWTRATVGFLNRPFPLRWPVSIYVEHAGFRDSYREIYPDPLKNPGLTWPSGRPHVHGVWNPPPSSPKDRIDFVYESGPTRALASEIVGDPADPAAAITVDPWGSDHRAVLSTFAVRPHAPPTLVAVADRLITTGQVQAVTFHAPGGAGERVAVTPAHSTHPVSSRSTGGATDGTLRFPTGGWSPGAYDVTLREGATALSRVRFWLERPGTEPSIRTSATSYAVGDPIGVTWRNAPGERWDWIGVYQRGANPLVASYLTWRYTQASIAGGATLDASAYGPWPLPVGRYSIYLLADDGYAILARAAFSVHR